MWLRTGAAVAAVVAVILGYGLAGQLAWERAGGEAPASATAYRAFGARPAEVPTNRQELADLPGAPAAKSAGLPPATAPADHQASPSNGLAWSNPTDPLTSADHGIGDGTPAHAPFGQAALQNAGPGLPGGLSGSHNAGFGGGGGSMGGVGGGGGGSAKSATSNSVSGSDELAGVAGRRQQSAEETGSEPPNNNPGANGGASGGNSGSSGNGSNDADSPGGAGGPSSSASNPSFGPSIGAPGNGGPGTTGPGFAGPGTAGPGFAGPGTSGPGTTGPGTSGPGFAGPGTSGPGTTGTDNNAGPDNTIVLGGPKGPGGSTTPPDEGGSVPPSATARFSEDVDVRAIPEPGSVLLALGAAAVLARRRRR